MPTTCYNTSKEEIIVRWQTDTGDAQTQRIPVGGTRILPTVPASGQVLASKASNELAVYASIINSGQPLNFTDGGVQYGAPQESTPPVVQPKRAAAVYSLPQAHYNNDPQPWKLPLMLLIGVAVLFALIYICRKQQ